MMMMLEIDDERLTMSKVDYDDDDNNDDDGNYPALRKGCNPTASLFFCFVCLSLLEHPFSQISKLLVL